MVMSHNEKPFEGESWNEFEDKARVISPAHMHSLPRIHGPLDTMPPPPDWEINSRNYLPECHSTPPSCLVKKWPRRFCEILADMHTTSAEKLYRYRVPVFFSV